VRAERPGEVDAATFRGTARHWSTGVAVITARHNEEVFAKTVSSLCTLSLEPPLISVAVDARSPLVAAVRGSGRYAVAVLADHQEPLARRFAARGAGRALGLFRGAPMLTGATGAPVLEDCLAWFDCRVHAVLPGGDHALLVGRVAEAGERPGEPLLYHDGRFCSLTAALPAPASVPVPTSPTGARRCPPRTSPHPATPYSARPGAGC
jgi:flavin reductase (DIM6/NTAB) family NADH-FMN oxidoreductase RutF